MRVLITIALAVAVHAAAPVGSARANAPAAASEAISQRIQSTLPADLQVTDVGLPPDVSIPADATISVTWKVPPRAGHGWVHLAFSREGRDTEEAYARVKLVRVQTVLVAQRPLRAGARLQPGDVALQPHSEPGLQMGTQALIGSEILRDVAPGKPLRSDAIAMPTPVPRGSAVSVIVRAHGLRVTAAAVLEQPAIPGEMAIVRIEATRQVVRGRFIDGHTVIVTGGES